MVKIINKVFDWKETDEMSDWIAKMHSKKMYVYQSVDGYDDTYLLFASKSRLTPKKVNDYYDYESYGQPVTKLRVR